jgi:hypothetical protein
MHLNIHDDVNLDHTKPMLIQYSRRGNDNQHSALENYSNLERQQLGEPKRSNKAFRPPNRYILYEYFSPQYRACLAKNLVLL